MSESMKIYSILRITYLFKFKSSKFKVQSEGLRAQGKGEPLNLEPLNRRSKQEQSQTCLNSALQGGGRPKVNLETAR